MELIKYPLERVYLQAETLGSWYDSYGPDRNVLVKTMELPWIDNERNVSCIPEDIYEVHKMSPNSQRKYWHFRFKFVKGRTMNLFYNMSTILIHPARYSKLHLKGCIGVGKSFYDFDKDGWPDLKDSKEALKYLVDIMPDKFLLDIREKK